MALHSLLELLDCLLQVLVLTIPLVVKQSLQLFLQRSHLQGQRMVLCFHISNAVKPFLMSFHLANLGFGHSLLLGLLLLLSQGHLRLDLLELFQLCLLVLQLSQIVAVPIVQHLGLVLKHLELHLKLLLFLLRMLHTLGVLLQALGHIRLSLSQFRLHGLRFSDSRSFTPLQEVHLLGHLINLLNQICFSGRRALPELLLVSLHVRQQEPHGGPHIVEHHHGVLVLHRLVLLLCRLDRLRGLQRFGPLLHFQK
mmetsp:Transcript_31415/g.68814  ORF Transcript_31415/g.68814 Transcript_31415/m.68814 type:complete len:253 (+) Transcript_31415:715-1473(+)